jgi:hypothetical protein
LRFVGFEALGFSLVVVVVVATVAGRSLSDLATSPGGSTTAAVVNDSTPGNVGGRPIGSILLRKRWRGSSATRGSSWVSG